MPTVFVDVDHTLLRPGPDPVIRPSAAPFLRALRDRGHRIVALTNGAVLETTGLFPLFDAVFSPDDPIVVPDGPWVLVDDDDPVHDGTRRRIERLGVVPSPEVWLRHYVQCTGFRGVEREPLTLLVPLVQRTLDLQAGVAGPDRAPIPTHWIVLVVVRRDGRFLLVNELHHAGWFLPAGRVEPTEPLAHAARREVLEESGVHVEVTGLLRVEHRPSEHGCRVRVFVVAEPLGAAVPRSTPNAHTREARWVTLDELRELPLRTTEVVEVLEAVEGGLPVVPWSIWDPTGTFR